MTKKFLMIFLVLGFFSGIALIVLNFLRTKNPVSVSVPFPARATPTVILEQIITPTPINPLLGKGNQILDDLEKISNDLPKLKKEESRLFPPEFYIEKEVLQ